MKNLEKEGYTCLRTAGSHGFCDIIAIKTIPFNEIRLIQCKLGESYSVNRKAQIEKDNYMFNGTFNVSFEVL